MRNRTHYTLRSIALSCLAVLAMATVSFAAEANWHFTVHPAAVVTADTVTLGDIATPSGDIAYKSWQNFAKTKLWPAPDRIGRPMAITRPKLKKALRHYLGGMASKAVLPGSLVLQRGGKVVTKDTLAQMVTKTVTNSTQQLEGEVALRDVAIPNFIFLRDQKNSLDIEPLKAVKAGRVALRFREKNPDGTVVRRISGGAFLDVWVSVPCAATPLNRNDVLTPEAIAHQRKNLAYLNGTPWDGTGGPYRVKRTIGGGNVILESDLETVPVITKGTRIDLLYKGGAIRLTTVAQAMSDGRVGEIIPVRNLQSKKQIYATVLNDNTVVIERNK